MLRFLFRCLCGAEDTRTSDEVGDYPLGLDCSCGNVARVRNVAVVKDGESERTRGVNGAQLTDATRKLLSMPLGKKNVDRMNTVKDIDAFLDDFARRNPSLKRPESC